MKKAAHGNRHGQLCINGAVNCRCGYELRFVENLWYLVLLFHNFFLYYYGSPYNK